MQASARTPHRMLQNALLGYLALHPDAADGLPGIRQWWLPRHLQDVSDRELRDALGELVERNAMRRTAMPDGTNLYACVASARPSGDHDPPPRALRH